MEIPAPRDSATPPQGRVVLRYEVNGFSEHWIIPEEIPVSEAVWHDGCVEHFRQLLVAWVAQRGLDAAAFRDLAVRPYRDLPRVGFNPDVCLVQPAPPDACDLKSLRLWDHAVPALAFEAVSDSHPYKDYALVPDKCAAAGVRELIVFDPLLAGPRAQGGPWLLQLWRRAADGGFERVHTGSEGAWSSVLGAFVLPNQGVKRVCVAGQPDGSEPWLTREEQALERERQAVAREQRAIAREQRAIEAAKHAQERVAELEAELARR